MWTKPRRAKSNPCARFYLLNTLATFKFHRSQKSSLGCLTSPTHNNSTVGFYMSWTTGHFWGVQCSEKHASLSSWAPDWQLLPSETSQYHVKQKITTCSWKTWIYWTYRDNSTRRWLGDPTWNLTLVKLAPGIDRNIIFSQRRCFNTFLSGAHTF